MIVVDGAVDLPPEAAGAADAEVRSVSGDVYVDGLPFHGTPQQFWSKVRHGCPVATTAPTVSRLLQAFEASLPVVAVHVSGALSQTVSRAREAAQRLAGPAVVVDSGSLSVGAGLVATEARRLLAGPATFAAAAAAVPGVTERLHTFAVVADSAWLVRSGRAGIVPRHASMRRPMVLAVRGRALLLDQPRDRHRAVAQLAERARHHAAGVGARWALGHGDLADVEAQAAALAASLGGPPEFLVAMNPTVGAHLGPDALVLAVLDGA